MRYDGEWKSDPNPNLQKTPEETAFALLIEDKANFYRRSRPDSIIELDNQELDRRGR
jgi:hypothetical protein